MRSFFIMLGILITLSGFALFCALVGLLFADPHLLLPLAEALFASLILLCAVFVGALSVIHHGSKKQL